MIRLAILLCLIGWPNWAQTPTGKATNRIQKSGGSQPGKKPRQAPASSLPSVPVLFASVTGSQANLTWTASTDAPGGAGVIGYQLQRCYGVNCSNFALIASPSGTSYIETVGGPMPGGSYTYRVRAVDVANQVSAFSSVTVVLPHWVELTWTPSTSEGVTGYNVYRRTYPGGSYGEPLNVNPVSGVRYEDHAAIAAGGSYAYVLRSFHPTLGESVNSMEVSCTIPRP